MEGKQAGSAHPLHVQALPRLTQTWHLHIMPRGRHPRPGITLPRPWSPLTLMEGSVSVGPAWLAGGAETPGSCNLVPAAGSCLRCEWVSQGRLCGRGAGARLACFSFRGWGYGHDAPTRNSKGGSWSPCSASGLLDAYLEFSEFTPVCLGLEDSWQPSA